MLEIRSTGSGIGGTGELTEDTYKRGDAMLWFEIIGSFIVMAMVAIVIVLALLVNTIKLVLQHLERVSGDTVEFDQWQSGPFEEYEEELDVGVYHPTEDDMNDYLKEKYEQSLAERRDPYAPVDWNSIGE